MRADTSEDESWRDQVSVAICFRMDHEEKVWGNDPAADSAEE